MSVLRRSALIAGLAVLVMALTVPIVEFYIFPTLVDYTDAAKTTENIRQHTPLFSIAIFIHVISVICDLIAAWALYIFLRPVNKNLALLTSGFRVVNTAFTIAALSNLVQVISLLRAESSLTDITAAQFQDQILLHIRSFNLQWRFMLIFFGVYMNLLGFLVLKARYIPKLIGILLIITGIGYMVDDLKYFFYPNFDAGFLWFTYFGELIFMFWLLIWGSRLKHI